MTRPSMFRSSASSPDATLRDPSSRRNAPRFRSWIALAVLAVAVLVLAPSRADAQGSVAGDREALEAFYTALDGDNWAASAKLNWNDDSKPLGEWAGIETNAAGRVIQIQTTSTSKLVGSLPTELGNLTELKRLGIGALGSSNNLSGTIPASLGNLSKLELLSIPNITDNPGLTGAIPTELGMLSNLLNLDLGGNELSGPIPTQLGNLSKLEQLMLVNNSLTGEIPAELGMLSKIRIFNLSKNSLTGEIPAELGNLGSATDLGTVRLSGNSLTGCWPNGLRPTRRDDREDLNMEYCASTATVRLTSTEIPENGGTTTVTAMLDRVAATATTLEVSVEAEAPAVAGDVRLSANTTLSVAKGARFSTGTVTITAVDNDESVRSDKTVNVRLSATSANSGLDTFVGGNLMIVDDESRQPVTLHLGQSTIEENGGATTVTATLDEDAAANVTLTVSAAPVAPAVAGDFTLSNNKRLTIPAGSRSSTGTVTLTAVDNNVFAPDRRVTVSAMLADTLRVAPPEPVILTIANDEAPPELMLHLEPSTINENGGRATLTATLLAPAPGNFGTIILPVSLEAATPEGAGAFVLSGNKVLNILPGETASTDEVTIAAVDNDATHPDRAVTVSVEFPVGLSLTTSQPLTLTIVDDESAPGPGPGPGPTPGPDPTPEPPPTATLSLERSTIDENGGATTVTATLDGAATAEVMLTVSAAPVAPAVAGDFALSANTVLTIAAGETSSTGEVTLTAVDNHVYAPENKTVTVSAAATGAGVQDPASVILTIVEDDEKGMAERDTEMVLAGMARGLASGAVNVLGGRFDASPAGGARMTLAGHRLQAAEGAADGTPTAWYGTIGYGTAGKDPHRWPGASLDSDPDLGAAGTALSEKDLLLRSSFELPLNASGATGAPAWTLWGRGAASGFSGSSEPGLDLDGTFYSGYLGMDYRPRPHVLLGLALSHSKGTVDYERTGEGAAKAEIDVKLNSVLPYVHWEPQSGLGLWTLVGAGSGDMRVTTEDGGTVTTDLASYLGAAGVRRELATLKGVDLAVKADAFTATVRSKGNADEDIPTVRGNAVRVRAAVEGSLDWEAGPDSRLTPSLELGGRWDDGTSERGLGAEVGGGLAYTHAGLGLSVEAEGRYLLVHKVSSLDEWGASLKVKLDPGASGRGASLTVAPVWGRTAGGTERLWAGAGVLDQLGNADGSEDPGWTPQRLDVALAYGLPLSRDRGMVTPYSGVTLGGSDSIRYRLGSRMTFGPSLNFTLEGDRTEQANEPPSHGLSAQLGVRW